MQELPNLYREAMLPRDAMRRAISQCGYYQPVRPGHVCLPASGQAAQRSPRRVPGGRGIWTLAPKSALAPSRPLLERMTDYDHLDLAARRVSATSMGSTSPPLE